MPDNQNDDDQNTTPGADGDNGDNRDGGPPKNDGDGKKVDEMSIEDLRAAFRDQGELIKRLRVSDRELPKIKRDYDAMKAKLDELEQKDLSEKDREKLRADNLEKERDRFREEVRQRSLRAAVQIAALKLKFRHPEDAFGLLTLDGVEYDDNDEPKGVEELVKKLAEEKDYLIDKATPAGGPPGGDRSDRREGKFTREQDREILGDFKLNHLRNF